MGPKERMMAAVAHRETDRLPKHMNANRWRISLPCKTQPVPINKTIMRARAHILILSLILGPLSGLLAQESHNVLLILVDDMGWSDLSCYGNPIIETPHIDGLAAKGIRFTNAYADPVCAPTRAAIQTGLYSARLKMTGVPNGHCRPFAKLIPPEIYWRLKPEYTTLAEALSGSGYVSGIFGKWHLGYDDDHQRDDQGYIYPEDLPLEGPYAVRVNQWISENSYKGIGNQVLKCIQFIEQHRDQPFFCIASYSMVHTKPEAREELVEKYRQKVALQRTITDPIYAAMCETVDETVGLFQTVLADLDLLENTLVIFCSDNGGVVEERGFLFNGYTRLVTHNWPLRDEKGTLYEGGIRVPFIASWPGHIEPGNLNKLPIHSIDIFPTLLELAGASIPLEIALDGISILPMLKGGKVKMQRDLFWHYPHYHHSTPASAIRSGDYKLIYFYETETYELYNLSKDLGEQYDLAGSERARGDELYARLEDWLQIGVKAGMPRKNPHYDPKRKLIWGDRIHPDLLKSGKDFGLDAVEKK